jgi:UPF0716 family protein affecting phage T7 exclusion
MNGYYRLLFSLLCYMVADLLGMMAVGHPTGFGVWTLAASVVIFLIAFTLAKREHGLKP